MQVSSMIIENQRKYIEDCRKNGSLTLEMESALGNDYESRLNSAIEKAWDKSLIPEICSVQPFTMPIGIIKFFRHTLDNSGNIPQVLLKVEEDAIGSQNRKLKAGSGTLISELDMENLLSEMDTEITREVLGTMLNAATGVKWAGDLDSSLRNASNQIHRVTHRGAGNRILGNKKVIAQLFSGPLPSTGLHKVGVIEGRWYTYCDDSFPENELLIWRRGGPEIDSGLVYSPYLYNFWIHPEDDDFVVHANVRHTIKVVDAGNFCKITIQ